MIVHGIIDTGAIARQNIATVYAKLLTVILIWQFVGSLFSHQI